MKVWYTVFKWPVFCCDWESRRFPWRGHHVSEHKFIWVEVILNIPVFWVLCSVHGGPAFCCPHMSIVCHAFWVYQWTLILDTNMRLVVSLMTSSKEALSLCFHFFLSVSSLSSTQEKSCHHSWNKGFWTRIHLNGFSTLPDGAFFTIFAIFSWTIVLTWKKSGTFIPWLSIAVCILLRIQMQIKHS